MTGKLKALGFILAKVSFFFGFFEKVHKIYKYLLGTANVNIKYYNDAAQNETHIKPEMMRLKYFSEN